MLHPLINVITRVVRDAGKLVLRNLERLDSLSIEQKGENDFVTEADRAVEAFIKEALLRQYPTYAFKGEESGQTGMGDFCWICDPIDGTGNFIRGIPHFCISLALKHGDKIEHAIIFDPVRQEIFTASLGEGAFLNNHRIRVNLNSDMEHALIALSGKPKILHNAAWLAKLKQKTVNFRHMGSAALDCAYVAAGRLDIALGVELSIWDFAAGILLIQEAGGIVSSFQGGPSVLKTGNLLAGRVELIRLLNGIWDDKGKN